MKTKEERLLEWLLSEDWVIADSHTHTAIDIDDIQRSFVVHFPDAPVPDSGDVDWEDLIQEIKNLPECEKHIYWDEMPDGSKCPDGDNGAEPISKWAVIRIIHALAAKTGGQE